MMNKIKDFVTEQSRAMAEPAQVAREAAVKSAGRIKSLQDPIRASSRSGVKLTAVSQGRPGASSSSRRRSSRRR